MKVVVITLIGLFLLSFAVVADEQSLAQAEDAYQNGDYEASIAFYEFSLLDARTNGAIYANLAHAYYMNGQIGKAMLNYRRAQNLIPRNPIVAEQIQVIEVERVDGIIVTTDWLTRSTDLTSDTLTLTELSIIVFILWTVFFIGIAISRNRKVMTIIISGLGIIVLILGSLLVIRLYDETQRLSAVVISEEIPVMSGPSNEFLVLFVLYEAIDLYVLENREEWVRIGLSDGRQGWILESSLEYIPSRLG